MGKIKLNDNKKMEYKIYTLEDPITAEIVYIGLTKRTLKMRLRHHNADYKRHDTKRSKWIKTIRENGALPVIKALDVIITEDKKEALELESFYIQLFISWGFDLLNEKLDNGKGRDNYFYQKPLSGSLNGNFGNTFEKAKISVGAVIQLDLNGDFVKEYTCVGRVVEAGFHGGCVSSCCRGSRSKHKDFQFVLKKDYDSTNDYKFKPVNNQKKVIYQYSLDNTFISSFNSGAEANRKVFNSKSNDGIAAVCRGERKTYKGFKWSYKLI